MNCEKVYERSSKNFFLAVKTSGEEINKFTLRGSRATIMSIFEFLHFIPFCHKKSYRFHLVVFSKRRFVFPACNERNAFFTSEHQNRYKLRSCQTCMKPFIYVLDNIYIHKLQEIRWILTAPLL